MAQTNLIHFTPSDDDLQAISGAIETLLTRLQPQLTNLSIEDRRELPKMGDKTVNFVEKAREYAALNPDLVPAFLDLDDFSIDIQAVTQLVAIERQLRPFMQSLDDSLMAAGSEAYQAALVFYRSVKVAKSMDVPNARAIYEDLAARFPGNARSEAEPQPAEG